MLLIVLVVVCAFLVYKFAKPTLDQKIVEVKDKVEDKVEEVKAEVKAVVDVNKDGEVSVIDAVAAVKEAVKKPRKPKK